MPRRIAKKAKDYVRCGRCRRLCEREHAIPFNGLFYGRECIKFAISSAETQAKDLKDLLA